MKNQENVIIKKVCHSRTFLSGIYNALKNTRWGSPTKTLGDDANEYTGMTPNLMGFTPRSSSSRSVSMRDIGAAPRGFTARSVTPQSRYAGYSGRTGFTLIELLVVVLIIGILAAVALPQYQVAVKKADLSRYMQLVRSLREAEEVYYLETGTYTSDLRRLNIEVPQRNSCFFATGYTYYSCPPVRYGIFNNATNAQAGDTSIRYVQYFDDYSSETDANGLQFTKGTIACYSKGDVARKACRSLGTGEEYESGNTTWDYYFILK